MKKLLIFLIAFVALFLGCSEDTLLKDLAKSANGDALQTEMTQSDLKANNGKAVTKTIKSRSSGTIAFVPNSSDCNGFTKVLIQGQGNATHLGLFTIELSYCSDGVNPLGPILGFQTAANGDKLFTALVGGGFDPELGPYQDYIYYDGTGRFEGASGEVRLYGSPDYDNLVFENHGEGTLTY